MPTAVDFSAVFSRLKRLYASVPGAVVTVDLPDNYCLYTPFSSKYQRELFLGSVQVKKNYVSFYLMPVYMFPDLLAGISPDLKKRMQGKSCFNFKTIDEPMFAELESLTGRGLQRMRSEGLL